MPNKKVTDLTEVTTPADGDLVYIVDVSDTTDSAAGSSRYVQASNLRGWPRTAAEISASVTPVNLQYEPGHSYRYGTNTTPGTTDMTTAIQNALSQREQGGARVFIPGEAHSVTSRLDYNGASNNIPLEFVGEGWHSSIKWDGAAAGTLLRVSDAPGSIFRNFRLRGDTTNVPSALLEPYETSGGDSSSFCSIESVLFGTIGGAGGSEMVYGIHHTGSSSTNNDSWVLTNVKIDGASTAGITQGSIQNLNHTWNGVWISRCDVGAQIAGSLTANSAFFFSNDTADFELLATDSFSTTAVPRIELDEFGSEQSGRMLLINGSALIDIKGGYWQLSNSVNADGKVIHCENNATQLIKISNYRFIQAAGYTGPTPSISVKTLAAGASVKHLILDGIRDDASVTDTITVDTQGSTDRRIVYLRTLGATGSILQDSNNILQGRGSLTFDADRQSFQGFIEGAELSADPAAPAAPTGAGDKLGRLYFRDNGAGKTQLVVRFETGAVQVLATQP